ncbi:glycosyltransferase [Massilia aerilata]|uniref:Glycosyltransferase n=1 Tax=Massilia aerilata TaxID=453817 RepID=A0ABW0RU90_9BURK
MANILLGWELGRALGHAGRLKSLALPLLARGHDVSFALRDLVHTQRQLAGIDAPKFQAPFWQHRVNGLPKGEASLADILLACGWIDAGAVNGLVDGWRALLQVTQAELVVCDYAPTAVLAARSLGIPSAAVGAGFTMPPALTALPPLRDWEPAQGERMAAGEARVLDSANAVLARYAAPPLARASGLLLGDAPLLCTFPELDPWRRPPDSVRWYGPNVPPSAGAADPQWPAGAGARVFAYLNAPHAEHAAMLQALGAAGCRTLCYAPEVAAGARPPVVGLNIAWARAPVDLAQALPACEFVVCHAGESTVSQALLAGRPLLLMPQAAESFLTARRVREMGAGINIGELAWPLDWAAIVRSLLDGGAYRQAAQAFAKRHAGFDARRQAETLADALEVLALKSA